MTAATVFDLDAMMAAAERETGLSDWGEDDIRTPLEVLFRAVNEEARFEGEGAERARLHLNRLFTGRLRFYGDRKRYPEIAQERIVDPIFMGGMPRGGTTYMNELIACDDKLLSLYRWQAIAPSPPPNHPGFDHRPQKAFAVELMDRLGYMTPEAREKHDQNPLKTCEDTQIREYSFISDTFGFFWFVPSYDRWYTTAERGPAFRFLKQFLQTLQYGTTGKRFALKAPPHINNLGRLYEEFPDARVIVNHRDPTKVMASLGALRVGIRGQFGQPASEGAGRENSLQMLEGMARGVEDMIRRRKADPVFDSYFADVNYVDLERDPMSQVEKIYERFDMELTEATRDKVRAYVAANRKEAHRFKRYPLEVSGLRREEVLERFKDYMEYFDVPYE